MEAEVIRALQRLYGGDVAASRELEAFQVSPGALELSVKLLSSSVPEIQFFAASTVSRIAGTQDPRADVNLLLGQAVQLTSPASAPARRQLVHAACTLGAGMAHAFELMREETWQVSLDLLLAMPAMPVTPADGCGQLLTCCLGQGRDADLWRCCLKFPNFLRETPRLLASLEEAIAQGLISEIESPEQLSPDLCQRFKVAAVEALQRQHWDAPASFLLDLPLSGADLLEAADFLLRSGRCATKLKALELWTKLLSLRLSANAKGLVLAWQRFQPSALLAAQWRQDEADEEMWSLRDALWTTIRRWQLTPGRPTLLAASHDVLLHLVAKLEHTQSWLQNEEAEAEAAMWLLSKYGKTLREKKALAKGVEAALRVLQIHLSQMARRATPLVESILRLLEAVPCAEALPLLLDPRLSPFTALPGALAAAAARRRSGAANAADAADAAWAAELQRRAMQGETQLVKAAAELLEDVRPLAQPWAKLCSEASPMELPTRARALVACMARPEVCQLYWRDCAQVLVHVPVEEQVHFVQRVGRFAISERFALLEAALELWLAVWPNAEGDEDLVLALEQLVQASARRNDTAAKALQTLCRSLASAASWAPQVVSAALGAIEASVTPSGSTPWPLTLPMVPFYGPVLRYAASISFTQKVSLGLVGLLVSWDTSSSLGVQLREALLTNESAVRTLCSQSDEQDRATQRIKQALGL